MSNEKPNLSSLRIDRDKKYNDRPRSKAWLWIVVVVVLAGLTAGYFTLRDSVTPATQIRTATVKVLSQSDAATELVATGYVVAQRKAEVASKGTGRLVYLGFVEGDTVSQGEVIARLDNDDIRANLELARANLEQAKVDTLDAGRQYRRQQELFETGGITDVELETAEARYKNALATLEAARAAVKIAEVDLENTYIRAPFDGTVLTKNAEVGEIVAPFASSATSKGSVVTLADMNSLEVEADVSESNIFKVKVGQPCEIILDAYPSIKYTGFVKKIVPTADRARATVLTKVGFAEIDDRVLPEMSARVNFLPEDATLEKSEPTIVVSRDAITQREGRKIVFRVEGERVQAVTIETGRELGSLVEVTSGLREGDRVVLNPAGKMQSGEKIEVSMS